MSENWLDSLKHNRLLEGDLTAAIKIGCRLNKRLNLRPLITTKGEIEEWQLMISDPPQIDWAAACTGPKPTPGSPILTPLAIRFHPADIDVSIDLKSELTEIKTRHQELRWPTDMADQYPLEPENGSSNRLASTSST